VEGIWLGFAQTSFLWVTPIGFFVAFSKTILSLTQLNEGRTDQLENLATIFIKSSRLAQMVLKHNQVERQVKTIPNVDFDVVTKLPTHSGGWAEATGG